MATNEEGFESIDDVLNRIMLPGVLHLMCCWLMLEDLLDVFWSSRSGARAPEKVTIEVM